MNSRHQYLAIALFDGCELWQFQGASPVLISKQKLKKAKAIGSKNLKQIHWPYFGDFELYDIFVPNYSASHDALYNVRLKFNEQQRAAYLSELSCAIMFAPGTMWDFVNPTPAQQLAAMVKAIGMWQE